MLDISETWDTTIIRKPQMPILENTDEAVRLALARPVGSGVLAVEAVGRKSACVAICDITRPVPNSLFLPILLRGLIDAGIPADRVTLLVATGLHRPSTADEIRRIVGDDWVLNNFQIVDHYARRDEDHVSVGVTSRGTIASIDRRFVEADLRIVTGLVEPHLMAGYSGGRKVISPGLCHADTVSSLHRAEMMGDPNSANCILDNNPLHKEQLEILEMVGRTLAVNTVIDEFRRLSFVNFGEANASHLAAVEYARPYVEVPVKGKFKTVVTTGAGYPLDCNYYQSTKGIVAGMRLLAEGGTLLIATECAEGLGSPEFVESQRRFVSIGREAFLREIAEKPLADIDEWGTQMLLKAIHSGTIGVYSRILSDKEVSLTGAFRVHSLEDAIHKSIDESGDNRVAVIPEGPYVIPVCN